MEVVLRDSNTLSVADEIGTMFGDLDSVAMKLDWIRGASEKCGDGRLRLSRFVVG